MLNEKLKDALRHHLQNNPTDATEVLALVTEVMQHYERALQAKRTAETWHALHTLVGQLAPPSKKGDNPVYLLDAAYLLFPRGMLDDELSLLSPVLRAFADRFIAACKAAPFKLAWIATTRGENCTAWYAEHVMPRLV